MNTVDVISQIGISVFGIISIALVARKNKWGFVAGLAAQPFWFATTIINRQWGIFALSLVYTIIWTDGINKWFFKEKRKTPSL